MPPALRSEETYREPKQLQNERAAQNVIGQVSAFPVEKTLRAHHHFAKFRTRFEHPLAQRKPHGFQGAEHGEEDLCRSPAFAHRALLKPHDSAQTLVYMSYRDARDRLPDEDGDASLSKLFGGGRDREKNRHGDADYAQQARLGITLERSVKRAVHQKLSVWSALYGGDEHNFRSGSSVMSEASDSPSRRGSVARQRSLGDRVHSYNRATATAEQHLRGVENLLGY